MFNMNIQVCRRKAERKNVENINIENENNTNVDR